jgi:hypothetical protein
MLHQSPEVRTGGITNREAVVVFFGPPLILILHPVPRRAVPGAGGETLGEPWIEKNLERLSQLVRDLAVLMHIELLKERLVEEPANLGSRVKATML